MAIPLESLFCEACGGYVHPFLEACPACGVGHASRFDDAAATPDLGFGALIAEPRFTERVREIVVRYSLKRMDSPTPAEVREGFMLVADSLSHAVEAVGANPVSSKAAYLELAPDELVVRERNPSREVLRVPLDAILAIRSAPKGGRDAGAWAGLVAFGRREQAALPAIDGDLVVTFATAAGPVRLAISNRRGITVARARPDHYEIIGRWLAIIASAAAEARWISIGAARHAADLGLAAPPAEAPGPGDESGPAATTPSAASVTEALSTLEELRSRGLVTEAEYTAKRREILARL